MVEWKGSVEGDGGRKAIMVDDSQPSSSGGAGEGSDVVSCSAQIGTLGFITSRSQPIYLDLSSVKKCHVFNRVNVINFVDVRRSEIGGLANK
ncbi:hypothetical protein ACOMHN_055897 [Nucella lapillus]